MPIPVANGERPVIKANAYGLGDVPIAKFLVKNKCKDFWVANIIEALKIKKSVSNINIYVANGLNKNEEEIFFKNKFIPVLNTYEQFKKWTSFLNKKKSFKKLAIQVDTGMCRSGMQNEDILKVSKDQSVLKEFKEVIILTHLASADEKKSKYNSDQKNKFLNELYVGIIDRAVGSKPCSIGFQIGDQSLAVITSFVSVFAS